MALPRLGLALALFLFTAAAGAGTAVTPTGSTAPADKPWIANHVVVRKAEHKLFLYHDKTLLAVYPIELGLSPTGQKEREDDFRTPEGHYLLDRRNPHSDYFLSIQVSYPNKMDEQRARRHHWTPGGEIMIHGSPNSPRYPPAYYADTNWTNGCIALSNANMVEFWMRTADDIPIDIYP